MAFPAKRGVLALRRARLGWCLDGVVPGGVDPLGSLLSVLEDIVALTWCAEHCVVHAGLQCCQNLIG